MKKGNKGEWSEIYTLLKLISDGVLPQGDAHLVATDFEYIVEAVYRAEKDGLKEYHINSDQKSVLLIDGEEQVEIPLEEFEAIKTVVLDGIRQAPKGTFLIEEAIPFLSTIHCLSLKAKSSSKKDIEVLIYDYRVARSSKLGFSIKSQLGNPSTLLNASKATNFQFWLPQEVNAESINKISTSSKIKKRIEAIYEEVGQLVFTTIQNQTFANNLCLIDSALPQIMASLLLIYYSGRAKSSKITDLVEQLRIENPLGFLEIEGQHFYEYKIKRFLTDVALGMTPNAVWDGRFDAGGGYIVVRNDGELVCYHIYDRNQFEDYLFHNTKLDTPSSSRHGFGLIYREGGENYFNLNIQIRFSN